MLAQAITEEFAAVVAALLGGEPRIETGQGGSGSAVWAVRFSVEGAARGTAGLSVLVKDASDFTTRVLGLDGDPSEEAVSDNLTEAARQAAGIFNAKQGTEGIRLTVIEPIMIREDAPAGADWVRMVVGDLSIRIAVVAAIDAARPTAPDSAAAPAAGPPAAAAGGSSVPPNLDLILGIDLPLWVRFGETAMTIQALSKLGPGTTVELDRSPDDPVDVLVNNTVVARGEVVVVSGNYGVRVTEVVSTTARIRSLGGLN